SRAGDIDIAPQASWSPSARFESAPAQQVRTQVHVSVPEPEPVQRTTSVFETRHSDDIREPASDPEPVRPFPQAEETVQKQDEDDLGIPAFIRRKMM
ncbi:MAG: hypothetical protein O3B96_00575, partial [bacterium]|nr:hypothetical protein [bacterium]